MSAGALCGVAPFFFRKKASAFEAKASKIFNISKNNNNNNVRNMNKASTVRSSSGVADNFVTMTELRNKLSTFRDLLDFSPCLGSASLIQLLILTVSDIFKRYPKLKPDMFASEIRDASMHKALRLLCDALKSLGDLWTTEEWLVKCKYNPSMKLGHVDLEQTALGLLDDIIKLARERLFDEMDEDIEMRDYNPPASNAFGKALAESYSSSDSVMSVSCSPATPTSVLPEAWKGSSPSRDKLSYSPPLLLPLRVQAVGKLNPIDVKRLSFHMFPHALAVGQDPKYILQTRAIENEEHQEVKEKCEVKAVDENKVINQDDEMMGEMEIGEEVNHQEPVMKTKTETLKIVDKIDDTATNCVGIPTAETLEKQEHVSPVNNDVTSQAPVPPKPNGGLSVSFAPPPPPPPVMSPPLVLPPPPPLPPTPMTPQNLAVPPPAPVASGNAAPIPPPPPPMSMANGVAAPPPPPPPMGGGPKGAVPPPPPMSKNGAAAPPPPPGVACLRPKKSATKLKRSSQMGNLYRLLKGKVEGSSLEGKSSGRKGKIGAASTGGKQGMADALAEMTKRSAYFQQIEEDVKNYAGAIKEVKTAISAFQTSDMNELQKFHKYVESHLEKLTDETQVLARFEDFPGKKLEALRMSAALYYKLDTIANTLKNWPIVSPAGQLLDKAEGYFNKIKVELDALERTKDEEAKRFQAQKITFDFGILIRIKELMVDVSSNCMELALKEKREAMAKENRQAAKPEAKKNGSAKVLWRAFQFAFRVYTFAGGHDDRADKLTRELAQEIETDN